MLAPMGSTNIKPHQAFPKTVYRKGSASLCPVPLFGKQNPDDKPTLGWLKSASLWLMSLGAAVTGVGLSHNPPRPEAPPVETVQTPQKREDVALVRGEVSSRRVYSLKDDPMVMVQYQARYSIAEAALAPTEAERQEALKRIGATLDAVSFERMPEADIEKHILSHIADHRVHQELDDHLRTLLDRSTAANVGNQGQGLTYLLNKGRLTDNDLLPLTQVLAKQGIALEQFTLVQVDKLDENGTTPLLKNHRL